MQVIRGAADNIMSCADSEVIAQMVNQVHTGGAGCLEIENMGHGFAVSERLYDPLVSAVLKSRKQEL